MFLSTFVQVCISQNPKRGLILNGGSGFLYDIGVAYETARGEANFKYSAGLGYKTRFYNAKKPFFYDLDLTAGIKRSIYHYRKLIDANTESFGGSFSGSIILLYTSLKPAINYKIYRSLFAGAGIEPTIYFKSATCGFDLPVTLEIGYDHKFFGWALSCKHGLFNTLALNEDFHKGKMNEVVVQLFIPF